MTTTGRSADSRRMRRGPAQWLLGLLIALAIGASIAMVFSSERSIAASLAVIAALWAAVIGAILVTKFRRQADSAESKARDLRLVYELQLEREITARRQYELGVETQIRKEVQTETNEELGELKAQIQALRASLELLVGGDLPEQRAALRSERLRELDRARSAASPFAGASSLDPAAFDDGAAAERDFATTAPDAGVGGVPVAHPNSMTEVFPVVTDHAHDDTTEGRGTTSSVRHGGTPGHPATPESPVFADAAVFTDDNPTDEWPVAPAEIVPDLTSDEPPAAANASAEATRAGRGRHGRSADPAPAATPVPSEPSPSTRVNDRHRAPDPEPGAHEAGRSVSELMDQLRAGTGGGRRRRRED